jgi:HlyD family secretion protein
MTANTRIVTDERDDVLRVPVRALRFAPRERRRRTDAPDTGPASRPEASAQPHDAVWVLRDGQPQRVPVVTGLSDGSFAEIVRGDLAPGDNVVIDEEARGERGSGGGGGPGGAGTARPRFHF